jgi:hypothetical protein
LLARRVVDRIRLRLRTFMEVCPSEWAYGT